MHGGRKAVRAHGIALARDIPDLAAHDMAFDGDVFAQPGLEPFDPVPERRMNRRPRHGTRLQILIRSQSSSEWVQIHAILRRPISIFAIPSMPGRSRGSLASTVPITSKPLTPSPACATEPTDSIRIGNVKSGSAESSNSPLWPGRVRPISDSVTIAVTR